ncbi:hypothetical protein Hanom_Chr01g00012711 [Helianthus anomalus]
MSDRQHNANGENLTPKNVGHTWNTPPVQHTGHIGTSVQGGAPPMFIPDFSLYSAVLPPVVDLPTWYSQQQAALAAAYNKTCTDAQTPGGPMPAPYIPRARVLQYEGRPPTHPTPGDRRGSRGSSYCTVYTLEDGDSTYGYQARGPARDLLSPHG